MAGTALNVAYDQMNMMYGASLGTSSKYDAHKKEDLRSTSDRISKSNRRSPLYKISESKDVKRFAIDIKEQAHMIKNIVASLSENGFSVAMDALLEGEVAARGYIELRAVKKI